MSNEITIADPGEQTRILNLLQMYENGALSTKGQQLRVLPLMCKAVIDIRKYNRKLLNQLRKLDWRPFKEDRYPNEDEEVLMQLSCDRIILTHFKLEDVETFEQEGVVRWLRFPTPSLYVIDDPIMKGEDA